MNSPSSIRIELITTSEIRITCLIDESRALRKAFEMEEG